MIRVEVIYSPRLTNAEKLLVAIPNRMANFRPLMRESVAPAFNAMLSQHWRSEGGAFGHRWAPLMESTISRKLRKGTAHKGILHDSDHLFRALFRARSTDDRLRVIRGGVQFSANTSVPYAVYPQVGTSFMPERQVIPIPLPESFRTKVRNIVRAYIQSGVVNAG